MQVEPERLDELLEEIVGAYEQFKDGSSPADLTRLQFAAGQVYYAVKGADA